MAPFERRLCLPYICRGGRDGAIAQLGERIVRNDEVGGSIPPGSTTLRLRLRVAQPAQPKAKRAGRSPTGEDGLHPKFFCLFRPAVAAGLLIVTGLS